MAYFSKWTPEQEAQAREWVRLPETIERLMDHRLSKTTSLLHPVVRDEYEKVTGQPCKDMTDAEIEAHFVGGP